MTEAPSSYRELRDRLAALPVAQRLPWLTEVLRAAAAGPGPLPGAWRFAQSLIRSQPELLGAACTALEAEEAARAPAIAMQARLLNRREDFAPLRALLARWPEEPPAGAAARRAEWLRCALVAPGADPATWDRFAAMLPPLARLSHDAQRQAAAGLPVDAGALLAALDPMRGAELAPPLARLAAAESVAIIGNGSGLLGTGAAAAIEAHEVVLRLNFPVVTGHEADVGRRTDLIIFAEAKRWQLEELRAREASHAATPAFAARVAWPRNAVTAADQVPRALAEAVVALGYAHPTTGFFAMLLAALVLRRRVTLFGFDFFRPGRPGHYWGDTTAGAQHELAYERWMAERFLPLACPGFRVA